MHSHLWVLRRVGTLLVVFGALHAFALAGDLVAEQPHAFSVDAATLILGVLLGRGHLAAVRVTAFVHALALAAATGIFVALDYKIALHRLPPSLLHRPASFVEWLPLVWSAGWLAADVAIAFVVVRELRAPAVEAALARTRRGSARASMRWGAGVGLGLAALLPLVACWRGILD
jgi:hypothetical protein